MGIRAVHLRDIFELWFFHGRCDMLSLLLLRCFMWLWGVWLERSMPKRVYEVVRSALFEVRSSFGPQNPPRTFLDYTNGIIQ